MRRLPMVILMIVALVAVVTGCHRAPRYDSRLVAADSLMRDNPDSALAIVSAVNIDSLTDEGDHAYRDLLITQARYKCYIVATTDSDINRALNYYRRHDSEREKLTRAYIYKGTVMEELGHPDSAMLYYKHAEATADKKDFFYLGYINARIADLYREEFSQDSAAIIRLKNAIHYYGLLADTSYIIPALGNLGSICGVNHPDSAKYYLSQAILLAREFDPKLQYSHMSTLAGVYYYQKDFEAAKSLAMDIFRNGKDYCEETQFYYYAALSYLKLGLIDSAKYVLKLTPKPVDAVDSMNYYNVIAEISSAQNEHYVYKDYNERSHHITERILSEYKKATIAVGEIEYDKQQSQREFNAKKRKNIRIAVVFLVLFLLLIAFIVRYAHHLLIKRDNEINSIKSELENALANLQEQLKRNKSVSELVAYRTAALTELYQDLRIKVEDESRVKKVLPLSSIFKDMYDRREILDLNLKDKFWENMKLSVDGEYNGIYSFVEKNFPDLTEKDLQIFCLQCANLSPQLIRLCMNLTSARTITNYRSVIVKKKMGLDMSLDDFIQKYLNGELEQEIKNKN